MPVDCILRPLELILREGLKYGHADPAELLQHFPGPFQTHEAQFNATINHCFQILLVGSPDHLDDRRQELVRIGLYRTEVQQNDAVIARILAFLTGNTDSVIAEIGVGLDLPPDEQFPEKQLQRSLTKSAATLKR